MPRDGSPTEPAEGRRGIPRVRTLSDRCGRAVRDPDGQCPGAVPGVDGVSQAPHIDVAVFARGLLRPVITRIYFPDDPANAIDPVLSSLPIARPATLLAGRTDDGYRFDIRLQGDDATAFFDL